jgi:preprotein translocase SecE subunit
MKIILSVFSFLENTIKELKKVDWITKGETLSYTITVIFFLTAGTLLIAGIDMVYTKIRAWLFLTSVL